MESHQTLLALIRMTTDIDVEECIESFTRLLSLGQTLPAGTKLISEHLCQEIKRLTQGSACLSLEARNASTDHAAQASICAHFPVQCGERVYGSLHVMNDQHPSQTALPLVVARALALLCGILLHQLELTALVNGQARRLSMQVSGHLTKREQEILQYLCHGQTPEEIASLLHISPSTIGTHQKHLCQKLGIHSERDIPLAAYLVQSFPFLE